MTRTAKQANEFRDGIPLACGKHDLATSAKSPEDFRTNAPLGENQTFNKIIRKEVKRSIIIINIVRHFLLIINMFVFWHFGNLLALQPKVSRRDEHQAGKNLFN